MQKIVTVLPEDTFGISKILPDYVVETRVHRIGQSSTKMDISHYYSTPTLKAKLLNLIARRKIARDVQATLNGLRGSVVALMTIDHTRRFFTNLPFAPETLALTSGPIFSVMDVASAFFTGGPAATPRQDRISRVL